MTPVQKPPPTRPRGNPPHTQCCIQRYGNRSGSPRQAIRSGNRAEARTLFRNWLVHLAKGGIKWRAGAGSVYGNRLVFSRHSSGGRSRIVSQESANLWLENRVITVMQTLWTGRALLCSIACKRALGLQFWRFSSLAFRHRRPKRPSFSVVNGCLLRPLAYGDPSRLVVILHEGQWPVSPDGLSGLAPGNRESFQQMERPRSGARPSPAVSMPKNCRGCK